MHTINQPKIEAGLQELGIKPGQKLLVHSALSSFGHVEGGAEAVIDALLAAVGETGTVLVPTLTGSEALSPENPPSFDTALTPCWTGRIPETFRQRNDAVRSLHPTHSVAAIGPDATRLTSEHINSLTPCDAHSPYVKLTQHEDGYILLLGVDHSANTTLHAVEEAAGVDYHMQLRLARSTLTINNERIYRHFMLHAYGTRRNFNIIEPVFIERGTQVMGKIGLCTARLIHARSMFDVTLQALRANARFLCA